MGWTVSRPGATPGRPAGNREDEPGDPFDAEAPAQDWVEDFGLFCLVDLPEGMMGQGPTLIGLEENGPVSELLPLDLAAEADLIIYVLDGLAGLRAVDYRWLGQLRRLGRPLLIVLNKIDALEAGWEAQQAGIEQRLAASILPVSARTGYNVMDRLVDRMVDACPRLAVPLGRELHKIRRYMAGRLIRKAALFNGLIALEPLPLLDIPLQLLTLVKLVLRIAAIYDRPPTDAYRREVFAAVAGGLAGRFAAQQALKLVPVAGWLAGGGVASLTAWLLGQAAVSYFEAGGDAAVAQKLTRAWLGLGQGWQAVKYVSRQKAGGVRRGLQQGQRRLPQPRLPWSAPDRSGAGEEEGP